MQHELLEKNKLAPVTRSDYHAANFKQALRKYIPHIFIDYDIDWPAKNRWTLPYLKKLAGKQDILLKNVTQNIKHKANFQSALEMIEQTKHHKHDRLAIQMARIYSNKFISRGQANLAILQQDICLPTFIHHWRILEINFWACSDLTFTDLHYDPLDNLLTVLQGEKQFILFPPSETNNLYYKPNSVANRSMAHSIIDVRHIDNEIHPNVHKAKYYTCTVKAGETLFIPSGYWHSVQSYHLTLAVNAWWLPNIQHFFKKPTRYFWAAELSSRIRLKGSCTPHAVSTHSGNKT